MLGDSKAVCNAYANSIKNKSGGRRAVLAHLESSSVNYALSTFSMENDFPPIRYSSESQLSDNVRIKTAFFLDDEGNVTHELEAERNYTFVSIFETDVKIPRCITGFVIESSKGQWMIKSQRLSQNLTR